jgi:hypothetical protein
MEEGSFEEVHWNQVPGLVSNGLAWRFVMAMHSAFFAVFNLLEINVINCYRALKI